MICCLLALFRSLLAQSPLPVRIFFFHAKRCPVRSLVLGTLENITEEVPLGLGWVLRNASTIDHRRYPRPKQAATIIHDDNNPRRPRTTTISLPASFSPPSPDQATAPGAPLVTTEYKNGAVRFRDLDGVKVKAQPGDWGEVPVEDGAYILFTGPTGRQFCSWGGVGSAFGLSSSSSS